MRKKPNILVVGSLVMDLIVTTPVFPNAGETVIGKSFSTAPGGKGANQAVQAARLGAHVTMAGMVGNDDFGRQLRRSAEESGVDTACLLTTDKAPSAVGHIQIQETPSGTENRIIVAPGANHVLSVEDVAALKDRMADFDMVILQHEIHSEVNCAVASMAKAAGVPIMLNPAPSAPIPAELLSCLSYVCPNEHEAEDITGIAPVDADSTLRAAQALHAAGVRNVLITLGKEGSFYYNGTAQHRCPIAEGITSVDPTAAGDSFIGAFCTAVASGIAPEDAMRFANFTAGLTVSRMGAQPSLPYLEEVLSLMAGQGCDTAPYQILKENL